MEKSNIEIWKEIDNFPNYFISSLGRVRHNERILKPTPNVRFGYLTLPLYKDGNPKRCRVNRLVAEAFIPNPNNLPVVNHIDENKLNNEVNNLEWCTIAYNNTHGTVIQRRVENTDYSKHYKPVNQYDIYGNLIKSYPYLRAVTDDGFNYQNVMKCCKGKRKTHRKFIWRYGEE